VKDSRCSEKEQKGVEMKFRANRFITVFEVGGFYVHFSRDSFGFAFGNTFWSFKFPNHPKYFSERNGFVKPVFKVGGFRVFKTDRSKSR
jgi:hypothetical protein